MITKLKKVMILNRLHEADAHTAQVQRIFGDIRFVSAHSFPGRKPIFRLVAVVRSLSTEIKANWVYVVEPDFPLMTIDPGNNFDQVIFARAATKTVVVEIGLPDYLEDSLTSALAVVKDRSCLYLCVNPLNTTKLDPFKDWYVGITSLREPE